VEQDRLEAFMALVTGASRSITKIKARGMSNYNLGSTHTACLRVLYKSTGGLTRTQLTKKCELDKAQISRIISELEEKGYVVENSEKSGYKKKVMLTDEGKTITEDINKLVLHINNEVSGDISADEIQTFYKVFGTICANLKDAENYFDKKNSANINN
jgi:DNA-binding MarR family transcriptional regulator